MICESRMNHTQIAPKMSRHLQKKIFNLVLNIKSIPGCQGFIFDTRTCPLHVIYNVLSRALESEHKKGKGNAEKCFLHRRVFSTERDLFLRKI